MSANIVLTASDSELFVSFILPHFPWFLLLTLTACVHIMNACRLSTLSALISLLEYYLEVRMRDYCTHSPFKMSRPINHVNIYLHDGNKYSSYKAVTTVRKE